MKRKWLNRCIAVLLCLAFIFTLLPLEMLYADSVKEGVYESTDESIVISGEAEKTVTVIRGKEEIEETEGILDVTAGPYVISRDYEQECQIEVCNTSGKVQEFYLEADDRYEDLSLEIIKSGSKDSPAVLMPGESMEVELSIFAQNAVLEQYAIPVTGYLYQDGAFVQDVKKAVILHCELPILNLAWTKVSEDSATLRQNYRVRNNGDTLTDLGITASESIADYVSFRPVVSNYELAGGSSVSFSVQPDLAKMKENGITVLTGTLIASCAGKTSSFDCSFDTKGQEITVTTMGELALKQDGNPFSKFDVIEESLSIKYLSGSQYVEFSEKTSLEDVFDENRLANLRYQSDVDLGVEKPVNFEISLNSSILEGDADAVDLEPSVRVEGSSIYITVNKILKLKEYQAFVEQSLTNANMDMPAGYSFVAGKRSFEDVDTMISYTMKVNDYYGMFGMGSDRLGNFGFAYDLGKLCVEHIVDDYTIYSNPKIPSNIKDAHRGLGLAKVILTIGGFAVGKVNPVVGFFFGFAVDWLNDLIDQAQDELLDEFTATYLDILGRQCTNRGSITSSFYVPDYSINNGEKPSMYTASRLYADGYVNKTETSYDVRLNGKSAADVHVSGLTQTAITEIATDHLKPGEVNTLVFDYDTNPGSHSVNTDTKVTFLYPKDTQIGYIGTPDTLQEVRTMPDFAVYPENIYTREELIEGEETMLQFYVYNIGSRGGWFTVTAYDGELEIFRQENEYLDAFGSKTFAALWTPGSGSNSIRISIQNTSVNLQELNADNNNAAKSMICRQRQVPVIGEISYGEAVYEQMPYSLVFDVENAVDVTDMLFTVDGKEMRHRVRVSGDGSSRRYLLAVEEGLAVGDHQLKVSVKYAVAFGRKTVVKEITLPVLENIIAVPYACGYPEGRIPYHDRFCFTVAEIENLIRVELILDNKHIIDLQTESSGEDQKNYFVNAAEFGAGDHAVAMRIYYSDKNGKMSYVEYSTSIMVIEEKDSYFTFSLSEDIADPAFYISDGETCTEAPCEKLEEHTWCFKKSLDMIVQPQKYLFFIQHANGVLFPDVETDHPQLTLESCRTVTFEKRGAARYAEIEEIMVQTAGGKFVGITLPLFEQIVLSPGIYQLSVKGSIGKESFHTVLEVDVTQVNQVISLEEFVTGYYYKMEGTDTIDWYARMYYKTSYDTGWNEKEFSTLFDVESSMLKCYTTDISVLEQAKEAVLIVYSAEEVYVLSVKDAALYQSCALEMEQPEHYMVLERSSLNKVSFLCESEGLQVGAVTAATDIFRMRFDRSIIYLPDGRYTFQVTVSTEHQNMTVELEDEIRQETELIADRKISRNLTDVRISWAGQFLEKGDVFGILSSGKQISAYSFQNGDLLKTETGRQTLSFYLKQNNCSFELQKEIEASGETMEIQIGNKFQGSIDTVFGDDMVSAFPANGKLAFSLKGLKDENETVLSAFSAVDTPLKGKIVYTDINNTDRKFVMPAVAESINYGIALLPPEAGTYRISVELYTCAKENLHQHVPVTDPAVKASCTKPGLTEGSHCSLCGEIIAVQKTVPKSGHIWNAGKITQQATVFQIGEKVYTCMVCGASKTEMLAKKPLPKKGSTVTDAVGKAKYKVTKAGKSNGTVAYVKSLSKAKSAVVPARVKLDGVTYKVTSVASNAWKGKKNLKSVAIGKHVTTIGENAFYGCKNLKKIVIKSGKLKSVGKNAVKGIHKKAVIRVPKNKIRQYKKLFHAETGFQKTMTIKK